MTPAIQLKRISKQFSRPVYPFSSRRKKKKIQALVQVSLEIPRGSIFALVGPNGSGKTTLLRVLAGLLLADEGEVWIHGSHSKEENLHTQRQVGFASASGRDFYSRLTARQNLEFFAVLYDLPSKDIPQRISKVAHDLGLEEEFLNRPFQQLSTGVRQKLVLARVLLSHASILLLDEPTRSLDPLAKRKFRNLLKEFSKKFERTLLLTTHDLSEAEELADTVGILHQGRLLKVGSIQEFNSGNGSKGLEDAFVALVSQVDQVPYGPAVHRTEG